MTVDTPSQPAEGPGAELELVRRAPIEPTEQTTGLPTSASTSAAAVSLDPKALPWPARLLAGLTAALGFGFVGLRLEAWVLAGGEGAALSYTAAGPLWILALGALGLIVPLFSRPSALAWTSSGLLAACFCALTVELPPRPLNAHFGDGPMLLWVYGAASALGLLALGVAARRGLSREALLFLLLVAATANGKLFARESPAVYLLLLAGALTTAAAAPPPRWPRGALLGALCCALGLVAWVALAAALGDSSGRGWRMVSRLLLGLLLAYGLCAQSRTKAPTLLFQASLTGLVLALLLQGSGIYEAARDEGWSRVWLSRWRLFDMHPNGSAPLFGLGLALSSGLVFLGRTWPSRILGACLASGSALALWRSQSAASEGGAALALLVLFLLLLGAAPRRAWSLPALSLLALAAGLGFWCSGLWPTAQARLEQLTLGPSALGQRYHFWRMAGAAIADSPWVGQGPNQYYLHARFAAPSYYDATPQDLHPHNLALAMAEGAGVPALVLFGVLSLFTLECARRLLRGAADARQRLIPAALCAAWIAVLASNALDLGQSQQTFVPLWSWLLLGALAGPLLEPREPGAGRARRLWAPLLALVAWPLAGLPLASDLLTERGLALMANGQSEAALRHARWAQTLTPNEVGPALLELSIARRTRGAGEVLRVARRVTALSPGRAGAQLSLAEAALNAGQLELAGMALQQAASSDPLGPDQAERSALQLELDLRQGDLTAAQAELLACLRLQGSPWQRLERTSEGPRVLLFSPAAPSRRLDLSAALATLAQECIALARPDPVASRRMAMGISAAYQALGQTQQAIDFLFAQRQASERPFPSLLGSEWKLRQLNGETAGQLELAGLLQSLERDFGLRVRLQLAAESQDPVLAREVQGELTQSGAVFEQADLFFEHGEMRAYLRWRLSLALLLDDPEQAWICFKRLLRDVSSPLARRQEAEWGALRLCASAAPAALAAQAMALGLAEFDLPVARQSGVAALSTWIKRLSSLPPERQKALRAALLNLPKGQAAEGLLAGWRG